MSAIKKSAADQARIAKSVADTFFTEYRNKTPQRLKILDAFIGCTVLSIILQLGYAFIVGSFPFNSFLASFFCCLSGFVLTISLRMQADPLHSIAEGINNSPERSFADYVLAMCVMFLAVWNYIG